MLEQIKKHLEEKKPVIVLDMPGRFGIRDHIIFHEFKPVDGFFQLKKDEVLLTIKKLVPSNIEGGRPSEESITRCLEDTKFIHQDSVAEFEVVEATSQQYKSIVEFVDLYIARVNANIEKMKEDAEEEKEEEKTSKD